MDKLDKYLEEIQLNEVEPASVMLVTVAMILAVATKITVALGKRFLTKAGRACKRYKGNELQRCKATYQKKSLQAQMQVFSKAKGKCSKTKDPKGCTSKLDAKIAKLKSKHDSIIIS